MKLRWVLPAAGALAVRLGPSIELVTATRAPGCTDARDQTPAGTAHGAREWRLQFGAARRAGGSQQKPDDVIECRADHARSSRARDDPERSGPLDLRTLGPLDLWTLGPFDPMHRPALHGHAFRVCPEPFQAVERASGRQKNMDDEIEVVDQDPLAALDKKAEDILVLDLTKASAFTDFFVICTGGNRRQIQAIADAIVDAVGARGAEPALVEGYERGEWILIDYFDFIVHIFLPATREFYSLERLWADAERVAVESGPVQGVQGSKGQKVQGS